MYNFDKDYEEYDYEGKLIENQRHSNGDQYHSDEDIEECRQFEGLSEDW